MSYTDKISRILTSFPMSNINVTNSNLSKCPIEKQEDVSEANISLEILLMMMLLCISMGGGYFLKKIKIKFINESLFATLVGLIAGAILSALENDKYINNITNAYVKFFLILLLPPIVFESAYNMKKKEFFKQIGTITIFALLGTLISIIVTGFLIYFFSLSGILQKYFSLRESLAYGSLISATDPVSIISAFKEFTTDPNFFQIVLGESILNDAISIVFYETCVNYQKTDSIFITILNGTKYFCAVVIFSIIIGYSIGYLTALFLSLISSKLKNIQKVEIGLMVILPWVSYLVAQMLGLSGIVSILFNGVAHATYTNRVISEWSKITIKTTYEGIASIFETLVFIFLGIGFFSFKHPFDQLNFQFVLVLLIIVLLSRFLNIFICSKIVNSSRSEPINFKKQFFLWFAGCRGAMAFALSIKSIIDFPEVGKIFLVLTLIIASFTLIYSTLFLDTVLKACGIVDFCSADNFDESKENAKKKPCFDKFKIKIKEFNDKYMKKFIKKQDLNSTIEDNLFVKNNNLRMSEVKNSSTNEKRGSQNMEILDKNDMRNSLQLKNEKNDIRKFQDDESPNNKYNIYIEEKEYGSNGQMEINNIERKNFNIKNLHLFK